VVATLASIVFSASPLVYAAIGETISEKAGVVNLSMEGTIMLSAMTGFVAALLAKSVVVGFLAAMGVGGVIAAIIAFASIELRLNQIAVGFILALLGISLSSFMGEGFVGRQARGVPHLAIAGLSRIPVLGPVLFSQDLMVYGSYLAIIAATIFMFRTRRGLEMQGVGERPEAAFARGIPVNRLRYVYTIVGGALAGIGGAAFSLDVILGWREGLTENFGWIALAIVIFGGWNPARAAAGAYLFGALQTVALKLQPVLPGVSQVLPLMPFVLMILILVLIYLPAFRRAADRHPLLRRVVAGDPPSGLGAAFRRE
jgi:general nucleoside transport system permease protein